MLPVGIYGKYLILNEMIIRIEIRLCCKNG